MKLSKWFILFACSSIMFYMLKADIDLPFSPLDALYACIFGYIITLIGYNWNGFLKHYFRKLFSESYRKRSQRNSWDRKKPFLIFPFPGK